MSCSPKPQRALLRLVAPPMNCVAAFHRRMDHGIVRVKGQPADAGEPLGRRAGPVLTTAARHRLYDGSNRQGFVPIPLADG